MLNLTDVPLDIHTKNSDSITSGAKTEDGPTPDETGALEAPGALLDEIPLNQTAGNKWKVDATSWPGEPPEHRINGIMPKKQLELMMGLRAGHLDRIISKAGEGRNGHVSIEFKGPGNIRLDREWTASCRIRRTRTGCGNVFRTVINVEASTVAKLPEAYAALSPFTL
jgi:hypothetical protein